jgi:hypothetical protein
MTKSFITTVRIDDDLVVFQWIDTVTDAVTFCYGDDPAAKPVFNMDSTCNAVFIAPNNDIVPMGRFGYKYDGERTSMNSKQSIEFVFNTMFLMKYPEVSFKSLSFTTGDFLKAEEYLVKTLLTLYSPVFKPEPRKLSFQ